MYRPTALRRYFQPLNPRSAETNLCQSLHSIEVLDRLIQRNVVVTLRVTEEREEADRQALASLPVHDNVAAQAYAGQLYIG
jgi:hypothetical protein